MNPNLEAKNTVKADGQVCEYVTTCGTVNGAPRIMIIGNSVTRHEPCAGIGWNFNHGMAASAPERDYVHIVETAVLEKYPNAEFCVVQASRWEFKYKSCDLEEQFSMAKDFAPDLIITVISANIPKDDFTKEDFIYQMGRLHTYLSGGRRIPMIQTTSFFGNTAKNEAIKEYCELSGTTFVDITDLGANEENLAIGKFEHSGVAHHPGDLGMKRIAERIIEKINGIEL